MGAAVAGGWQFSAILSFYSGSPFTVSADGTSLNAPGSAQRADRIKATVAIYHGKTAANPYFDTTAFAPVTTARFGTSNFDSLRGPGYANADFGLFRTFRLRERFTAQPRIEILNSTNTPHLGNPNANVSSSTFGSITTTSPGSRLNDERYVRLGLKLAF